LPIKPTRPARDIEGSAGDRRWEFNRIMLGRRCLDHIGNRARCPSWELASSGLALLRRRVHQAKYSRSHPSELRVGETGSDAEAETFTPTIM